MSGLMDLLWGHLWLVFQFDCLTIACISCGLGNGESLSLLPICLIGRSEQRHWEISRNTLITLINSQVWKEQWMAACVLFVPLTSCVKAHSFGN